MLSEDQGGSNRTLQTLMHACEQGHTHTHTQLQGTSKDVITWNHKKYSNYPKEGG